MPAECRRCGFGGGIWGCLPTGSPLQGEFVHGVEVGEIGVLVFLQGGYQDINYRSFRTAHLFLVFPREMCLLWVAPAVCFLAFECNRKRIRFYTDPVPSRRFIAGQFAGADLATDVQSFFCCALHGKSSAHKGVIFVREWMMRMTISFFEKREKTGCEKQPRFPFTSGRFFSNHCRKGVVKRPRSSPLQVGGGIPSTGGCIQRKNIFIRGAINRRLVRKYVEDYFTKVFSEKVLLFLSRAVSFFPLQIEDAVLT